MLTFTLYWSASTSPMLPKCCKDRLYLCYWNYEEDYFWETWVHFWPIITWQSNCQGIQSKSLTRGGKAQQWLISTALHICASEDLPLDQSENKSGKNKLSVVRSNAKASTGEQLKSLSVPRQSQKRLNLSLFSLTLLPAIHHLYL